MGLALFDFSKTEAADIAPDSATGIARKRWGVALVICGGSFPSIGEEHEQVELALSLPTGTDDNFKYGAWGEVVGGNSAADATPFGFTGRWGGYTDSRFGQVLNWNRWYEPQAGRWGSRDPIGLSGGLNYYSYSRNIPVSNIDPSGKADCSYYTKMCQMYGGKYYCYTAPKFCAWFNQNNPSNSWIDCVTDCLQKRDSNDPKPCGRRAPTEPPSFGAELLKQREHLECYVGCGLKHPIDGLKTAFSNNPLIVLDPDSLHTLPIYIFPDTIIGPTSFGPIYRYLKSKIEANP